MSFHIPVLRPERRKLRRKRSKDRGVVTFENISRGCQVANISSDGAKLVFGLSVELPLRFTLALPNGRRIKCLRIWQEGPVAGVQFSP